MIKAAAITMICAAPAQAGIAQCDFRIEHHSASRHTDLGGGIITYEQSFLALPDRGQAQHVVENCRDGQRVITVLRDYVRKSPDRTDVVRATFAGMAGATTSYSLTDVQKRLRATGAPSTVSQWNKQSCGCAAAYPDLRLGKEEYKKPPGN